MKRFLSLILAVTLCFVLCSCTAIDKGNYKANVIETGGNAILVKVTEGELAANELFIDVTDSNIYDLDGNKITAEDISRNDEIEFFVENGKYQLTAPSTLIGVKKVIVHIHVETEETSSDITPSEA